MTTTTNSTFIVTRAFLLVDRWDDSDICIVSYDERVCANVWRVEDEEGAIDERTYPAFADIRSRAMRRFLASEYGIADDYKVYEL